MDFELPSGGAGVLPCQYLERAIAARVIDAGRFTIPEENVQPASLDLRLGEVAYRIRCSFLPDRQTVERRVKDYIIDELRTHGVIENLRLYATGDQLLTENVNHYLTDGDVAVAGLAT